MTKQRMFIFMEDIYFLFRFHNQLRDYPDFLSSCVTNPFTINFKIVLLDKSYS